MFLLLSQRDMLKISAWLLNLQSVRVRRLIIVGYHLNVHLILNIE